MLDDLQLKPFEGRESRRTVGEESQFAYAQVVENLGACAVVAHFSHWVAAVGALACLSRLQQRARSVIVGQLIRESDALHLLFKVKDDAPASFPDQAQRNLEMRAVTVV